jgi:signal transduction histidine kinase
MCLYRFTQEGLNNAFRHAGGKGQTVRAICNDEHIEIEVSDAGPGFDPNRKPADKYGLGLAGLRERIESLGGTLYIRSQPGGGARLTARFKVTDAEEAYG